MGNPTGAALLESQRQQAGAWISLILGQSWRKSSAAPKAPDHAAGCPGAALGIPGDFPGSPGAGIRVNSAARQHEQALQLGSNRPASLGFVSTHAHCLSCLLNTAFNPGANPQLQNRIWPLIFFSPFFTIILNRIHKEKGKKKVLIVSQTSKAACNPVSPSQLLGAKRRSLWPRSAALSHRYVSL